jgi:magnesium chelatase family protein
LIDRIDLAAEVPRQNFSELTAGNADENSGSVRERVVMARERQTIRYAGTRIITNSELSARLLEKYCPLTEAAGKLIATAVDRFRLSARSYHRLLKVSRTIADLDGAEMIEEKHLAEALQYRPRVEGVH